jgi:NSS family neurotransmitter:Na+ symporter
VVNVIGLDRIDEEIEKSGHSFRLKGVFHFMIRTLCPVFVLIIFAFSIAGILGLVSL